MNAIKHYIKKIQRKHKGFCVEYSGLVVNVLWPHLGTSPDGIRYCDCCDRRVVEVKSLFAKRNHGQKTLKRETRSYQQIQEELATAGYKVADLIIYTNKGILLTEVEFDDTF